MSEEPVAEKPVEEVVPKSPREAYDAGRAAVQKQHRYRYNAARDEATCACGETFTAAGGITMHVEGLAEVEGQRRRTLYLEEHQAK